MKVFQLLFLTVMLFSAATVFGQNINGCTGGVKDGIVYTNCWADTSNDTQRLRDALAVGFSLGGGSKVIFNERYYYIDDQLNLDSGTTVVGQASDGTSVIHQVGTGKPVFFIGAGKSHIVIRDLTLFNDNGMSDGGIASGNIGIKAEGAGLNALAAMHFTFDNLSFFFFDKGLYVNSSVANSGWQFDNAQLSNSYFYRCNWGVHLNSFNANMEMDNVVFNNSLASAAPSGSGYQYTQSAIWLQQAGYVVMNYLVGNGERNGSSASGAGEFLRLDQRSNININSAQVEAYKISLKVNGYTGYKFSPVTITNSFLPACRDEGTIDDANPAISFHNATVVSNGNQFGCNVLGRPVVTGTSEIYSSGDRFCFDPGFGSLCKDSGGNRAEWVVKSDEAVLKVDHSSPVSDLITPISEVIAGISLADKPLLSLAVNDNGTSSLTKYMYNFYRNTATKRLEVDPKVYSGAGDPTADTGGYFFKNGPVQLQDAKFSGLNTYNSTGDSGSLLYCTDCTAGSTPCAGSGSGALALKVGSAWHCK